MRCSQKATILLIKCFARLAGQSCPDHPLMYLGSWMLILPLPLPLSMTLSTLFDISKILFSHLGTRDKMHTLKEKEHLDLVFAMNPLILAARYYSSSISCWRKMEAQWGIISRLKWHRQAGLLSPAFNNHWTAEPPGKVPPGLSEPMHLIVCDIFGVFHKR